MAKNPKTLRYALAFLLILAFGSGTVFAQRQYNVAFLDISDPLFRDGLDLMLKLRQLNFSDAEKHLGKHYRNCFTCKYNQNDLRNIGKLYLHNLPEGLTIEDARTAVAGSETARDRIQRILQNYNKPPYLDDIHQRYLSGLVLYRREKGRVMLYALRALDATPIFLVAQDISGQLALAELDQLLKQLIVDNMLIWNDGFTI